MEDLLEFKNQRIVALEAQVDLFKSIADAYEQELKALYNQLNEINER